MIIRTVLFLSIVAANVTYAAAAPASPAAPDPTALFQWVIGGLCTVLFSLTCFVVSKIDKNQDKLFQHQEQIVERLARIEATCHARHEEP